MAISENRSTLLSLLYGNKSQDVDIKFKKMKNASRRTGTSVPFTWYLVPW